MKIIIKKMFRFVWGNNGGASRQDESPAKAEVNITPPPGAENKTKNASRGGIFVLACRDFPSGLKINSLLGCLSRARSQHLLYLFLFEFSISTGKIVFLSFRDVKINFGSVCRCSVVARSKKSNRRRSDVYLLLLPRCFFIWCTVHSIVHSSRGEGGRGERSEEGRLQCFSIRNR